MAKPSKDTANEKLLTEVELELMNILWRLDEGSVADVIEALPKERDLAYTSVSTILRILEQKKILKTRKEGRGHVYIPILKKSEYEAKSVRHMVDKVFDGAPIAMFGALVKELLDAKELDAAELSEIQAMLAKATRK